MTEIVATNETILVVGGGISGMTAALEAAECDKDVILIEKKSALGGRVAQLYRYFPKLCRPACGQKINQRRIKANKRLRVITLAQIGSLTGSSGDYTATIKIQPRYVKDNCTACGDCGRAVSAEIDDPHNYNMSRIKAAYLPNNMAWPQRYVIDPSIVGAKQGEKARAACQVGAVDLEMQEEILEINCGAVIFATGWRPYDAARIEPYGYERYDVEVCQENINNTYGTKFDMPVGYYSQLMSVAYGGTAKEAGLDGQVIRSKKLEEIANKT